MPPATLTQDAAPPPRHAAVFGRLAELAEPYALPGPWSWIKVDPNSRRLPDPAAAFAKLKAEFPADHLLASGVACQVGDTILISPQLATIEPGLIVLRTCEGHPEDIITSAGCVAGGTPLLEIHRDLAAQRALRVSDKPVVFGTFSLADAVLLRSLGLAAAPAVGLEKLASAGLDQLAQLTRQAAPNETPDAPHAFAPSPKDDDSLDESPLKEIASKQADHATEIAKTFVPFRLILVAGSLTSLSAETPAEVYPVARHLAGAEQFMGLAWKGTHVWCPTNWDLDAIRYHGTVRAAEALRQFLSSLRPTGLVAEFQRPGQTKAKTPSPVTRYFELLACLEGGRTDSFGLQRSRLDRAQAQTEFLGLVDRLFVRPFIERAMGNADPLEAALCMALASHVQMYQRMVPVVNAIQIAEAGYREKSELIPPEIFNQWHRLGERLLKLIARYFAFRSEPLGRKPCTRNRI